MNAAYSNATWLRIAVRFDQAPPDVREQLASFLDALGSDYSAGLADHLRDDHALPLRACSSMEMN